MLQLSFDNVREFLGFHDRRMRLFAHHRSRRRSGSNLDNLFRFTQGTETLPNLIRKFVVERTGMRLPLNPQLSKILQDEVALDFQFPR
jgi:hypothetical protein